MLRNRERSCRLPLNEPGGSISPYGLSRGIWVSSSVEPSSESRSIFLTEIALTNSLSKNYKEGQVGGVTPSTYVAFIIIESLAYVQLPSMALFHGSDVPPGILTDRLPFALLITPLHNVVRSDGTRIYMSEKLTTKLEFKQIRHTMTSKVILFSAIWAFWSFFYG